MGLTIDERVEEYLRGLVLSMVPKVIVGESYLHGKEKDHEFLDPTMKEKYDMNVVMEHTGNRRELLEKVKRGGYSAVLISCCMGYYEWGEQKGLDVVRELRKLDNTLPVGFMSEICCSRQSDIKSLALEAGATDYFIRLSDWFDKIPAAIARYLGSPK